jgi:hypothetical protein
MRKNHFASLIAFTALFFTHPATAGLFSKPEPPRPERPAAYNISVDPKADQEASAQMAQFEAQMETEFGQIGELIKAGDTQAAITKAQKALDKVGLMIGADPKAKLTQKYYVNLRFPEEATSLNDLNEDQKVAVISQFRFFRGGYFLDVLNLAKQTSLQYVQAVVARLEQSGQFTQEIRSKLVRDLIIAKLMPIPLVDNADQTITVFLDEIANENHTFLFDLDIETYLLTEPNFKLSKMEFDAEVTKAKAPFLNSERQAAHDQRHQLMLVAGQTCMGAARGGGGTSGDSQAVVGCFEKHYKQVGNVNRCTELVQSMEVVLFSPKYDYGYWANKLSTERANANLKCHDYYSKK